MRKIDAINRVGVKVRGGVNLFLVIFTLVLAGCSDHVAELPAASFGDITVLEKLAKSYEKIAEYIPVRPQKLRQEDKKKFVEDVFKDAGYNYKKTLLSPAAQQVMKSKHHRDLAELVLLPTTGLDEQSLTELYDAAELLAIAALKSNTKK